MVTAALKNSLYCVSIPTPVEDLRGLTSGANAVVGFDFPIGVPAEYAVLAGITDFSTVLPQLGTGRWSRFYDVAEDPSDIALDRPFYPMRPGDTSRHVVDSTGRNRVGYVAAMGPDTETALARVERALECCRIETSTIR